MKQQDSVDAVVSGLLRPMADQDLLVVFHDITTIRFEGLSTQSADVGKFSVAKEGLIARQFKLGVVQASDGLPIHRKVFYGNTAKTKTYCERLPTTGCGVVPPICRLMLVADRGLLSLEYLMALRAIKLSKDQALGFILVVPGRRCREFAELLDLGQECSVKLDAQDESQRIGKKARTKVGRCRTRAPRPGFIAP